MKKTIIARDQGNPIAYYSAYSRISGSVTSGVLLSQLVYWWIVKRNKFYKVDKEICAETGLSVNELRLAKNNLKTLGFISTELKGIPAKTYYIINADIIQDALVESIQTDKFKGKNPQTSLVETTKLDSLNPLNCVSGNHETTTESTAETTSKNTGLVSIVPDGTSIFSTGDNILVTIGEYEDGDQLAIIEEEPKLPEKPKSAGALLNEALALFQPIFPGDFIGKQTAFSKPPTREAVQALLDRLGMGGIKLLLEKYNNKKSEKFCPLAGTVYEFCTFKLAKIEAYVNKDGGLYAQRSISSPEHRSDLERKIAAKFEASREENRQALKEWLKTHPDDGMRRH